MPLGGVTPAVPVTGNLDVGLKSVSPVVHDTAPLPSAGFAQASYNVYGNPFLFTGKTTFF